ncbi:hypothetical protein XELAEV_18040041mg [Xenopus laevis]|uniref:Uncharacterized protein n=1 Tax=Xenopus laevis TaxID=8355 RepID=A0A974C906_XENLA|nr:hypothetical protein XELAEV_18040041mg [Xenopus laevis]
MDYFHDVQWHHKTVTSNTHTVTSNENTRSRKYNQSESHIYKKVSQFAQGLIFTKKKSKRFMLSDGFLAERTPFHFLFCNNKPWAASNDFLAQGYEGELQ